MGLKEDMESKGLVKGSLVKLVLKKNSEFKVSMVESNEVPFNSSIYQLKEGTENARNSGSIRAGGHMVEIDEEKIRLVQNYNSNLDGNDQEGYVGGTVYYFNVISLYDIENN